MAQNALNVAALTIALIGLGRLMFLILFRRPAAARVCSTDLSENELQYERDMYSVAHYDDTPSQNDLPYRSVWARVAFDVNGREQRADVSLWTPRGDRPDSTVVIWYDPSNPSRATGVGPAWAFALMLIAALIVGFQYLK